MSEQWGTGGTDDETGEQPPRDLKPRKKAREKIMDLLARRDHSELELRRKLAPHYDATEVEDAIRFAKESKWMRPPEELAATVAEQLDRRGKGAGYIQRFLRSKGLPGVAADSENELHKALDLIEIRLRLMPPFAYDDYARIARLLKNRGFNDETIRHALHAREKQT